MVVVDKDSKAKLKRLALSEPKFLKQIGKQSKRNGTDRLSSREINRIIRLAPEDDEMKNQGLLP